MTTFIKLRNGVRVNVTHVTSYRGGDNGSFVFCAYAPTGSSVGRIEATETPEELDALIEKAGGSIVSAETVIARARLNPDGTVYRVLPDGAEVLIPPREGRSTADEATDQDAEATTEDLQAVILLLKAIRRRLADDMCYAKSLLDSERDAHAKAIAALEASKADAAMLKTLLEQAKDVIEDYAPGSFVLLGKIGAVLALQS